MKLDGILEAPCSHGSEKVGRCEKCVSGLRQDLAAYKVPRRDPSRISPLERCESCAERDGVNYVQDLRRKPGGVIACRSCGASWS